MEEGKRKLEDEELIFSVKQNNLIILSSLKMDEVEE